MKKLIISAVALTLISFASVQAQTAQPETTQKEAVTQDPTTQEPPVKPSKEEKAGKEEKVAVKPEDLPEGIKKTIKGEEFSGWTVNKAFLVKEGDKPEYYELQVGNGKENARVKLDKNGKNVG